MDSVSVMVIGLFMLSSSPWLSCNSFWETGSFLLSCWTYVYIVFCRIPLLFFYWLQDFEYILCSTLDLVDLYLFPIFVSIARVLLIFLFFFNEQDCFNWFLLFIYFQFYLFLLLCLFPSLYLLGFFCYSFSSFLIDVRPLCIPNISILVQ